MRRIISIKSLIISSILGIVLNLSFLAHAKKPHKVKEIEFEILDNNFIPSRETIEQNLKQQYNEELNENINELQKPNLLNLLSGISISYKRELLKNSHGLTISFNLLKLLDIVTANKKYKFNIKKITFKNRKSYQQQLQEILIMLENLKKKANTYNSHIKIFKLKTNLYKIEKNRYAKGEIPPSEFLKKQIIYEYDKTNLQEIKKELTILKQKILYKSKIHINKEN